MKKSKRIESLVKFQEYKKKTVESLIGSIDHAIQIDIDKLNMLENYKKDYMNTICKGNSSSSHGMHSRTNFISQIETLCENQRKEIDKKKLDKIGFVEQWEKEFVDHKVMERLKRKYKEDEYKSEIDHEQKEIDDLASQLFYLKTLRKR